jgi:putative copper export protein
MTKGTTESNFSLYNVYYWVGDIDFNTMKIETRLSIAYFVLATLWIIFSDAVLAAVAIPTLVNTIQTYKGALFVIVTSLLLFALLRWEFSRRQRAEQAEQQGKANFSESRKLRVV